MIRRKKIKGNNNNWIVGNGSTVSSSFLTDILSEKYFLSCYFHKHIFFVCSYLWFAKQSNCVYRSTVFQRYNSHHLYVLVNFSTHFVTLCFLLKNIAALLIVTVVNTTVTNHQHWRILRFFRHFGRLRLKKWTLPQLMLFVWSSLN